MISYPRIACVALLLVLGLTSYGVLGVAAPLKGTMLCSGCEMIARELVVANNKMHRTSPKTLKESQFIEILEKACEQMPKYKLAQENFGGHFKVFADEKNADDMASVEAPDFFNDESNYQGATVRLLHMCNEYVGNYEEEIRQLLVRKATEKEIRDKLCLRATTVCSEDSMKSYKDLEKQKRKVWRRMKRREEAAKKIERAMTEELDDDEMDESLTKDLPKGLMDEARKKNFHPTNRAKEEEEKLARKKAKEAAKQEQANKRKEALQNFRKKWEEENEKKKAEGKGKTYDDFLKEYEKVKAASDWGDEGKLEEDDDSDL